MAVRVLIESEHLCPSWDSYFDTDIPPRHDVEDAESSLENLLDDLGLFALLEQFCFQRLLGAGALRMLVDTVCDVGSHTGTRARIHPIHKVVESFLDASLILFQELASPVLLDLEIAEVRRT